jgi:hypothetical protein
MGDNARLDANEDRTMNPDIERFMAKRMERSSVIASSPGLKPRQPRRLMSSSTSLRVFWPWCLTVNMYALDAMLGPQVDP